MTSAEENVLRSALNPWPLSVRRIANQAGRAERTTRKHLGTLRRQGLVQEFYGPPWPNADHEVQAFMATDQGAAALVHNERMRGS
jgi:predicted ArsR family transcriptional regulator